MSDSRLEKFIYAICSMDVSDLPVPLSRIEKLWNCLITGETPDFEPLSRNEKYLMAMLDRYDISNLPAPMSRGEKLLYKIAVGETDLSDVPGYLSQYEELLKYLIENGGISEGNFEYVLYTLNQSMYTLYTTAEKPVKSAILKGQTLVNVHPTDYVVAGSNPTFFLSKNIPKTMIKPNTRYFLRLYNTHQSIVRAYFKPCANNTVNLISSDNKCAIFTTKSEFGDSDFNNNKIHFYSSSELALEDIKDTKVILCEYVDGMENWDIPYFTGMQSVKMPVLTTSNEDGTKSNILTVNEEVTLRGIGDVKDELDLSTGELTQRIGEVVLDGSEKWEADLFTVGTDQFLRFLLADVSNCKKNAEGLCDKEKVMRFDHANEDYVRPSSNRIWIYRKDLTTTVEDLKQQLQANPYTIQYELATESIKTVGLTVVDQDNQPTQLGTFENVTHVSLVAENLIPEVEMEVATNLLEDTVFNLTDAFNTLYPTAAKPVKSASLKGQTLVNIATKHEGGSNGGGEVLMTPTLLKANTKYYIKVIDDEFNLNRASFRTNDWVDRWYDATNGVVILTTPSQDDFDKYMYLTFRITKNGETVEINNTIRDRLKWIICEYQEYMENWDIPYFEGMTSVKMPVLKTIGKNLFDGNQPPEQLSWGNNVKKANVKENTTYVYSSSPYTGYVSFKFYDNNDNQIRQDISITSGTSFTTPPNTSYLKTHTANDSLVQIEEGTQATPYEPFKSNILTVNEEVTLRGIGDVQDTLDCLTGELTQRIGEVVLDGSEDWKNQDDSKWNNDTHISFRFKLNNMAYNRWNSRTINCISDKFTTKPLNNNSYILDEEFIGSDGLAVGDMNFNIKLLRSRLNGDETLDGFKEWLSQNPFTLQYQLANESVKTVDLTVVDQDNQPTELGTFDNTTHVLLESEGLIPTASLTVETKIPSASSTSLLMNDISTEQQQLETTVDEQSNNVDATMIATTEIFEDTL